MMHKEESVHGKLDKILDSIYNEEHGIAIRLRGLEDAVIGRTDSPGLCEKVRILQSENLKQTALLSTVISGLIGIVCMKVKSYIGH